MLLIFPCVRLDCVSSASKTCLDYVWSANVFMLSVWAILPAQVSLPSLVEVVGLLHNWIRSPSRPLNEDHLYTSLFASPYKFRAPDCILGPDLGHILVPVLGSIFGRGFGALDFVCNCRDPKRCPKMEPETGTKTWPNSGPKMQFGAPNLYGDTNKDV